MKVLMISTDAKIFEEGSEVRRRVVEYGSYGGEIHVVVYTAKKKRERVVRLGENVFAYPTNTRFKPLYFWDAYRVGKKVINDARFTGHDSVLTTQDPFETALVGARLKRKFGIPLQIQIHSDPFSPYFAKESIKNRLRV